MWCGCRFQGRPHSWRTCRLPACIRTPPRFGLFCDSWFRTLTDVSYISVCFWWYVGCHALLREVVSQGSAGRPDADVSITSVHPNAAPVWSSGALPGAWGSADLAAAVGVDVLALTDEAPPGNCWTHGGRRQSSGGKNSVRLCGSGLRCTSSGKKSHNTCSIKARFAVLLSESAMLRSQDRIMSYFRGWLVCVAHF